MPSIPSITLSDGHSIPQFGLGVWKTPADQTAKTVATAFELGYRHIDTAAAYGNEEGVGQAIANAGIPREELFITTKLWNEKQGFDSTLAAFDESTGKLGLDYLDLYLIHWPCPANDRFVDTWKAFIRLRDEGRIRSIGVSNFRPEDIERLNAETGVAPVINQIEVHPLLQQNQLREFNRSHNIVTEAWSPLAQGGELLQNEKIAVIAARHGKSAAQVILRWHLELGSVIFPKSVTPARIKENADIFDFSLDADEMKAIATLDRGERMGADPATLN
ncbi:aldo/keto reductase [Halotalea alkalilenta]|uniref:Oxidoreductase n=1 Tax=Halotalea alkalilenta TaxID=376489 RepID=A0A172YCW2_9GAMM|nr:aldo/keto reductase [Halotalea alkalilenta]ANF57091.1 oxidoreductase [Halotalea alkalilenta]